LPENGSGVAGITFNGRARFFIFIAIFTLVSARHLRRSFGICRTIRCALQDALNASTHA
jgi:hypothetical protein